MACCVAQILRFSPHGAGAWYRPLVGGPNPFPLVVHAWKHTFSSAFLRKEIPATVAQVAVPEKGKHGSIRSRVDLPEDVEDAERTLIQRVRISKDLQDSKDIEHAVRDSSHPPSFEEVLSQDAGSSSSSSAAAVSSSLSSSSSEIRQQDTRSTDEDPQDKRSVAKTRPPSKGARTACTTAARLAGQLNNPVSTIKTRGEEGGVRGVGGSGEGDLRKKHDKAFPVEWSFSKWAARVTKWAFGDGMALPKR